jgi:hypothetical protein
VPQKEIAEKDWKKLKEDVQNEKIFHAHVWEELILSKLP